jgi:hypothetical protein
MEKRGLLKRIHKSHHILREKKGYKSPYLDNEFFQVARTR